MKCTVVHEMFNRNGIRIVDSVSDSIAAHLFATQFLSTGSCLHEI